jgi:S-adenosylmethionine:tRNA ribosyltransferase-isomerase
MKLARFNYDLPVKLVAQYPAKKREESRLMVVHKDTGEIEHRTFKDISEYFSEEDVFVVNDTKVFNARLYGQKEKTGAKIEVFLLRELNADNRLWDVIVEPARKIRVGNKLYFGEDSSLVAEVIDNTTSRGRTIRFLFEGTNEELRKKLGELGETPLPKYIKRPPEELDRERYQTVYANKEGAVAAPTAGLHFSENLIRRMEIQGIEFARVTLHTGLGTFAPIEVEDVTKHKMEAEYFEVNEEACEIINNAKLKNRKICAVGTSSIRAMESSLTTRNLLKPGSGWTNIFIYPPYDFSLNNCLLTNFHLPKTTLLIMVTAFLGHDLTMSIYKEAIKNKYNFFSYGDALLII